MRSTLAVVLLALTLGSAHFAICQDAALKNPIAATRDVAVGAQYDSTHVYVTPEDFHHQARRRTMSIHGKVWHIRV